MSGETRPSYEFGPFRLDLSEHMLVRDGEVVPLTPKTFELLRVLVQNNGHLVGKDTLLTEIWPDNFVEEGALNRSISVIRKALGEGTGQRYIETVPKLGYRFVAPVTIRHRVDPPPLVVEQETSGAEDASGALPHMPSQRVARTTTASRAVASQRAAVIVVLLSVAAISYALLLRPERLTAPTAFTTVHRQVTFTGKEGAPTLSPDGRRIAYVSNDTPEKKVMVQELAGGSPLAIFSAPEAGHLRWSPDGSELLVWARGAGHDGVYIVPQMGGTPRLVAKGMYIGCWSRDGSTIAIPSYLGGRIWFVNREGTRLRTVSLRDVAWSIWDIDWSPATDLMTFTSSDEQGRFTLWTVRPDGGEQTLVLTEGTGIYSARWAPRGDAIYYLRQLNQTDTLFKVRVSRGLTTRAEATALVTGLETDQSFALSADGGRIVYARAPYHSNLWLLDLGDHARTVAKELTRGTSLIERPHLSPDGRSIAFNIGHEPTANIYTMPIAGGAPKQLTFFDSFNLTGGWSADGRHIAFASTEGGTARVWIVSADGDPPRQLSSGQMSDSFNVTWSPGRTILYQQAGNRNYYQLDPETVKEEPFVTNSSVGWMFSPAYSPDGRTVAVMWNRPPNRGLWVIDRSDHREAFVYRSTAAWTAPIGWSADGRAIYAVEGKNLATRGLTPPLGETLTDARIVIIPLEGSPKTIATLPSGEVGGVTMTADARRFVYTVYSSRSDVWVVDNFDASQVPRVSWKH